MYINLKVKTLDSQSFEFSVDDEMTVKEFKEHIKEKVKIEADFQRLIYCGRVLNDEKPLKEYSVDGKCLHLVQRPPPSSTSTSTSTNNSSSTGQSEQRRFGAVNVELPNIDNLMMGSFIPITAEPSSTLCGNRITVARHMLQCANNIAAYLENPENGLNNQNIDLLAQQTMESTILEVGISAVTDADLPHQEMQNIVQAFQGAVSEAFRQNGINNITVQQHNAAPGVQVSGSMPNQNAASASSSITIEFPSNVPENNTQSSNPGNPTPEAQARPNAAATDASRNRQQTTSPQTLADVVEMMQNVQQRLNPFIQEYYTILREDPSYPDDPARERSQRIFNRTSEALHYMAHAQHAISDLMLNLSLPTPRHLCCRPILVEQSAFVSSGISQSINIGSIFGGARMNRTNNNNTNTSNNNPTAPNANAANNDTGAAPQPTPQNVRSGAESFSSSLLSAMGLGPTTNSSANNQANPASTENTATSNASATNTEGQLPRLPRIPSLSRPRRVIVRQSGQDRYRSFIQSLMNSAAQPDGVHIINANIAVPMRENTSNTSEGNRSREPSQTRSNTTTQPTTSTQTRSTTRPFLTSTTLPSTSIRHGRPIPANFLSSFDRFLPCNSHHIRDQQQQQNQSRNSTPRREARNVNVVAPSVNEQAPPTTSAVPPHVEDELNRRFTLFGIEMSLRDLNNLTAGFYGSQREEMRTFIRQRFFAGSDISQVVVSDSVLKMIEAMGLYLERLEQYPQINFIARQSVENYLMESMPQLINTIFEDTLIEFGVTFEQQLSQFCQKFYMILVTCIGSQNAEKYLKDIAGMVMTVNLSSMIQKYIDDRQNYDFNLIQRFLIAKPKVEVKTEERMEVDEEIPTQSNVQSEDIEADPLPEIRDGHLPWHSNFPSSWLPVITRDIDRQQRQVVQNTYSDAYISGMSAKRRKSFQNSSSPTNMKQLINGCVRDAMRTLGPSQNQNLDQIVSSITNDPGVVAALRDEVKETLSERVKKDPDFDDGKYPSSSKAFK